MHQLLIQVSKEDQIYFENTCVCKGKTFESFFCELLNLYREKEENSLTISDMGADNQEVTACLGEDSRDEERAKKRGRPSKQN